MAGKDEPDALSDVFNFGKFKRSLKDDDLLNPVKDLNEKADTLRKNVTIKDDDDDSYSTSHTQRGVCLILENDEFHPSLQISNRGGSGVDSSLMVQTFNTLGFKVRHLQNLTSAQIKKTLEKLSLEDHSDRDMLAVVILSHGKEGHLYSYDSPYQTQTVWDNFTGDNCPSLLDKPKLFFIQACQGSKMDDGVVRVRREGHDGDGFASYRTPTHADFLVAHSSVEGYYAWRNTVQGSWFIQVLGQALTANHPTRDLETILTRVARVVSTEYISNSKYEQWNMKKQIPFVYSTLTKQVYFTPK